MIYRTVLKAFDRGVNKEQINKSFCVVNLIIYKLGLKPSLFPGTRAEFWR